MIEQVQQVEICLDLRVSMNLMHCPLAFSPLCTGAQPFRRFRIDSSRIQTGFKQAPLEASGSYQKRKASNLIQRFIHHLTVAGVDLHCPLPDMA